MPEVIALGELLVDFTPQGFSKTGNPIFERNPGGAPANVLALLSKLGIKTAFIGKVGDDMFGLALKGVLEDAGIGTGGLILSQQYNTTLTFVQLDKNGDRSFGFIRRNGADKELAPQEVNYSLFDGAKLFHFGGVSLTDEPSRSATFEAAREAKKRGLIVSYDPNFRAPLWAGKKDAEKVLLEGVKLCDILKVSDDECRMLSHMADLEEGSAYIAKTFGPKLVFVTMGADGSAVRLGETYSSCSTFDVKTVDTTGAGDAFFGGVLYCLLKSGKKITELTADDAKLFMRFGSASGSLVTTQKGAILSMPSLSQIDSLLRK